MKSNPALAIFLSIVLITAPWMAIASAHSAGTNVSNDGTIYMISTDGQLRPYTSAGAYLSYGFNSWNNVVQANSDDLNLPIGDFIPPRDGKIVCSDRGTDMGTCYLITNGKKAGFTSGTVFTKLGFNFKNSLSGDVSFLPSTDNISDSTQSHLPGTLINDSGTVKLVGANGTVGVPSMDILNSWGYSLNDVVNANSSDKAISQSDVLSSHNPGQLAWEGTFERPTNSSTNITQTPTTTSKVITEENFRDNVILMYSKSNEGLKRFIDSIQTNTSDMVTRSDQLKNRVAIIRGITFPNSDDGAILNKMFSLYGDTHDIEIKYINDNLTNINIYTNLLNNYRSTYTASVNSLMGNPGRFVSRAELITLMQNETNVTSEQIYKIETNILTSIKNHYLSVIKFEDSYANQSSTIQSAIKKVTVNTNVGNSYYKPLPQSDYNLTARQQLLLNPIICTIDSSTVQATITCR